MGKYKRFVAYVYEYEEKRKGNNRGFVRVEARNGNCSMEFQLSGIDMEQEFAELSGFSKEGEKAKRIPLAACMVRGDVFRYRMETNALHMGESNMALEDLDGLVLIGPRHVYGTCWNGEEIPPEILSKPGEEEEEEPEVVMEMQEKPEEPERFEEAEKAEEPERFEEAEKAEEPERFEEAEKVEEERFEEVEEPEKIEETEKLDKPEDLPEFEKPAEWEKSIEPEKSESQEKSVEPERAAKPEVTSAPQELSTPQIYDTIVYNLDGTEKIANPPQNENISLHNTKDEHWAYMQSQFPHLDPFADGGLTECIKITPADMTYLQEQDWKLGNNNFLLHGYYSYRYLLLGRKEGTDTYVLGVPGIYDHQEKFMANMFGFPQFKVVEPARMKMGQFGYWYREIH